MKTILILVSLCLLSGCGSRNTKQTGDLSETGDMSGYEKNLYVLNFKDAQAEPVSDFNINDIAKDITFIPLETGGESPLMDQLFFKGEVIDDNIIISTGIGNTHMPASLYDSLGSFIKNIALLGRGPKEIPSVISYISKNDSLKILSIAGGTKVVAHSFKDNETKDIPLENYMHKPTLLNDGHYAALPGLYCSDESEPYLCFFNNEGKIIKTLTYPEGTKGKSYEIKEGEGTNPYEFYELSANYNNNAIFYDTFNDTIYKIKNIDSIAPYIVLNRESFIPKPKDANDREAKKKDIYIGSIKETQKFFFITYWHKGVRINSIWNKRTCEMTYQYSSNKNNDIPTSFPANYKTPDGREVAIGLIDFKKDRIYGVMSALNASPFLEDVKEDDNPVVMVIELK